MHFTLKVPLQARRPQLESRSPWKPRILNLIRGCPNGANNRGESQYSHCTTCLTDTFIIFPFVLRSKRLRWRSLFSTAGSRGCRRIISSCQQHFCRPRHLLTGNILTLGYVPRICLRILFEMLDMFVNQVINTIHHLFIICTEMLVVEVVHFRVPKV
jgi:hypothetical protein